MGMQLHLPETHEIKNGPVRDHMNALIGQQHFGKKNKVDRISNEIVLAFYADRFKHALRAYLCRKKRFLAVWYSKCPQI
jgi:hypothetical protein